MLINHLVERVLDDALGAERLQLGDDLADDFFIDDGLDRDPAGGGKLGNGGIAQGGESLQEGVEAGFLDVHFEADLVARVIREDVG